MSFDLKIIRTLACDENPMKFLVLLRKIRDAWHPLHNLRKVTIFRLITQLFDIPVWLTLYGVTWKVRVRLVRNASYWLNRRTIEPEILALFIAMQNLFAPKTFWDIGANIGFYSYLLKSWNRNIEILMFEPDPVNVELINQTIRCAELDMIRVFPYAVSDKECEAMFALDTISGATGTLERPSESFLAHHYQVTPKVINVKTVAIDEIRKREEQVDMIKIDVEGHEENVIRGGEKTINEDHPIVVFECFRSGTEIIPKLQSMGYMIFDAERMVRNLGQATNFLALPARYATRVSELVAAWKQEYEALNM